MSVIILVPMRKLPSILLVPLVSGLLLVGLVEVFMRTGVIRPTFRNPMGLGMYLDERLVYRLAPRCREDINGDGYRDRDFAVPRKPGVKRAVFLGDSFVMGMYVKPEETIPRILQDVSGGAMEVYNMGIFGYGPDQSLNQMLIDVPRYRPDTIILSIYPSNDFADLARNRLYTVTRAGELIEKPDNAVTRTLPAFKALFLIDYLALKAGIIRPRMLDIIRAISSSSNNDDVFVNRPGSVEALYKHDLMREVLKKIKRTADEMHAELLVAIIPSIWNIQDRSFLRSSDWPEDKLLINEYIVRDLLVEAGIRHINFADVFLSRPSGEPLYDPELDNHLSVYGHRVVADEIWGLLNSTSGGAQERPPG
jgi:hypothetical protein